MSMSLAQKLAADSIAAVAEGRNLQDVLAQIRAAHPELTAQENGALQDIAYGCQRYLGSLKHMLAQMLKSRLTIRSLKACFWRRCTNCITRATRLMPWSMRRSRVSRKSARAVPFVCQRDFAAFFCANATSLRLRAKKTMWRNTTCRCGGWHT